MNFRPPRRSWSARPGSVRNTRTPGWNAGSSSRRCRNCPRPCAVSERPSTSGRTIESPSRSERRSRRGCESKGPSRPIRNPRRATQSRGRRTQRRTRQPVREGPRTVPPAPVPEAARPPRVPTFVEGLDESLEGGIPWGHLVLIEGAPGTMKSSLAFSILLHNAAKEGLHCLYLSLEERASSLLRQMGSLGLKLDVPKGSLIVLDPRTAADMLAERTDLVAALEKGIRAIKEKRGLDLIVIDSLEALEVLAKFKDRRREMYRLFEWLRDLAVTSFVITERPDWLIAGHVLQGRWDEDFLADGVIQLRIHMVSDLEAQRRLRVVKMRGTKHDTGYLAMVLDDGRFRVTRAMST